MVSQDLLWLVIHATITQFESICEWMNEWMNDIKQLNSTQHMNDREF